MRLLPRIHSLKYMAALLAFLAVGGFSLALWLSSNTGAVPKDSEGVLSVQKLPEGFERVTVETDQGKVSVTLPRRRYSFQPTGRTYFVDRAGSDFGSGSKDRPFASIEKGVSELQPGDLLYIRGGNYSTPFTVYRSGLPGQPIIISSYPGETVRILQPAGWQRANLHSATV
ncbi:MAG: hypothetical protein IT210_12285, partial [Armatimonadetes bacterium]|nr:hypothetical protein [Armatimonadota bacterium]